MIRRSYLKKEPYEQRRRNYLYKYLMEREGEDTLGKYLKGKVPLEGTLWGDKEKVP